MTAPTQTTLRTLVLQTSRLDTSPAGKLLADLGHSVTSSTSSVDALRQLQSDGADLLVIDIGKADETPMIVQRLNELDPPHRPKAIAVLIDRTQPIDSTIANRPDVRVNVFLKPLHLHGLLRLVKRLERE
jgi:CheY-like chemotaxis protein